MCLVVLLAVPRVASAAAPICDERGASAIAPPPILAVPDVKLEQGDWPVACDLETDRLAAAPPSRRAAGPGTPRIGPTPIDALAIAPMPAYGFPRWQKGDRYRQPVAPIHSGFAPDVFRPPRG